MARTVYHGGILPTLCSVCMQADINFKKNRLTEHGYTETLHPERIRAMQTNRDGKCVLCWVVPTIIQDVTGSCEFGTWYLKGDGHLTELCFDERLRLQLSVALSKDS